jgi:hypothetical protein
MPAVKRAFLFSNQGREREGNSATFGHWLFVGTQHPAPLLARCRDSIAQALGPKVILHRDKQGVERTRPPGLVA